MKKQHVLKTVRKIIGLTQAEFSEKVGCSTVMLKKVEAGARLPGRALFNSIVLNTGLAPGELHKGFEGRPVDAMGRPYSRQIYEFWQRRPLMANADQLTKALLGWIEVLLLAAASENKIDPVKEFLVEALNQTKTDFKLEKAIDRELKARKYMETTTFRVKDLREDPQLAAMWGIKLKYGQYDDEEITVTQELWPGWSPSHREPPPPRASELKPPCPALPRGELPKKP